MHLGLSKDPESGGLTARVVDESYIDVMLDTLKHTHTLEVKVGAARVASREALACSAEADHTHKKQTGGTGQFARVKLRLEPNEAGAGNVLESLIVGGVVPTMASGLLLE
jgi:elongation factor G